MEGSISIYMPTVAAGLEMQIAEIKKIQAHCSKGELSGWHIYSAKAKFDGMIFVLESLGYGEQFKTRELKDEVNKILE